MTVTAADSLDLLDEPLRERAQALRRLLRKPGRSGRTGVADLICLAADAAFAGDQQAAAACLDQAEQLAAGWAEQDARAREAHDLAYAAVQARRAAGARTAADETARQRPRVVLKAGLAGHVRTPPAAGPVLVATDGSYLAPHFGWAYITSGGQWGLAARQIGPAAPDGHFASLTAELLAAGLAAANVEGPAVFLTDSDGAVGLLKAWQAGDVTRMPPLRDAAGATARTLRRAEQRRAALAGIAAAVAGRPDLEFTHVYGHRGHLLNEAADTLAKMARVWLANGRGTSRETMTAKADDLAAAFLRSWHQQPPQ